MTALFALRAPCCSALFLIRPISDSLDLRYFVTVQSSWVCGQMQQVFGHKTLPMLSWLQRLFEHATASQPIHPVADPTHRVTFDDRAITVFSKTEGRSEILWSQIDTVSVRTLLGGAWAADVFWVIRGGRQKVVLPFGAYGESDLVRAMQERLSGFDNMAVVEGLSSAGEGEIQVWPAEPDLTGLV